ncbi:MAG: ABC transporter ATP-binding protein [Gemmatimonadota bacterium]|nr:ABC transporter ATP-binding protein [Gemmatimonadota bacterium]MDH5757994.1 ABC transporter ATP-binding protein [Gemmatimonadota bacterium]
MSAPAFLEVDGLVVEHSRDGGRSRRGVVRAVDRVTFSVEAGGALGLVGESGCGKSSLARSLVGLHRPVAGSVRYDGQSLEGMDRRARMSLRRRVQLVFQNPFGALNPRMPVASVLREVLRVHGTGEDRTSARVEELLDLVGLGTSYLSRLPHELSAGQRQRVGLARALAVEPEFLILDEPLSALDVSIQAQMVKLFDDLRDRLGLGWIFISHDLPLVRRLCDRMAVMYRGRFVETGPSPALYRTPIHPYTKALVAATRDPLSTPAAPTDVPFPSNGPDGLPPRSGERWDEAGAACAYVAYCAHPERDASCVRAEPVLRRVSDDCRVACFKVPRER